MINSIWKVPMRQIQTHFMWVHIRNSECTEYTEEPTWAPSRCPDSCFCHRFTPSLSGNPMAFTFKSDPQFRTELILALHWSPSFHSGLSCSQFWTRSQNDPFHPLKHKGRRAALQSRQNPFHSKQSPKTVTCTYSLCFLSPHCLLPLFPSVTLLWPHRPSGCSLNVLGIVSLRTLALTLPAAWNSPSSSQYINGLQGLY